MSHEDAIEKNGIGLFQLGINLIKITTLSHKGVTSFAQTHGVWAASGLGNVMPYVVGGVIYTA